MASFETIGAAAVEIGAHLGPLKTGLAKAKGMVAGFSKSAGGMMSSGLVALGVGAGIAATIALSVKAFAEAEAAEKGLEAALRSHGMAVDENMGKMKSLADQIQLVTAVEGDSMLPVMQSGIAMGLTADQAMEAAKAAVGLSKAYGIDVKDAMTGVSKEMLGIESRLGKSIPALQGVSGATERLGIINQESALGMQQQFDAAETTTGTFEQLKNTAGDLMESLGGLISSGLTPLLQWINNLIQATVSFGTTSESMFSGAAEAVGSMGSFMGDVFKTIGSWISNTVFFFMTLGTRGKIMGATVMEGFGMMLDGASWAFDNIVNIGKWLWDNLGNLFSDGVNYVSTVFSNLFENTKRVFTGIWAWIKSGGKKGFEEGFVGLSEGFTAKTKTLPEYKKFEEGTLTKVAREDKEGYLKELDQKREAWDKTFADMPKQKEKAKKDLEKIDLQLTEAGQQREDEKQKKKSSSDTGKFSSPAEVWKAMQTSVLKSAETKQEQLAKAQLAEQKKMTGHLAKIADKDDLELAE